MTFSFNSLVLSGVKAASGVSVLSPGRYVCKVTDVEIKDTKDGKGKRMVVKLKEVNDKGVITDFINLHLPNSERATEIGQEQLKALLVHGGHPDPDNPGLHGLSAIKGLTVGVIVGTEKRLNGSGDSAAVKGYIDPTTVAGQVQAAPGTAPAIGSTAAGKLPF